MIAMIGTSDQPYWLAEACRSLLLLLLLLAHEILLHALSASIDPVMHVSVCP